MTVYEMLDSQQFDDIWAYYAAEYCRERTPDESARLYVAMKKMFGDLMERTPAENPEMLILTVEKYSGGDGPSWETAVYSGADGELYSLSFIGWDIVLGYYVLDSSIEKYGAARVSAHFLEELSFDGFSEEDMIRRRDELEHIPHDTEHEGVSISELMEELGLSPDDEIFLTSDADDRLNSDIHDRLIRVAAAQYNKYKKNS